MSARSSADAPASSPIRTTQRASAGRARVAAAADPWRSTAPRIGSADQLSARLGVRPVRNPPSPRLEPTLPVSRVREGCYRGVPDRRSPATPATPSSRHCAASRVTSPAPIAVSWACATSAARARDPPTGRIRRARHSRPVSGHSSGASEALLDLGCGGKMGRGLLVAPHGRGERAASPADRPPHPEAPASWPENGASSRQAGARDRRAAVANTHRPSPRPGPVPVPRRALEVLGDRQLRAGRSIRVSAAAAR